MKVALEQYLNVFPRLHCQRSSIKSKHVQLPRGIVLIILLGLLLHMLYLSYTPYNVREHDVPAHLDYIQYIATNWRLPDQRPADGEEYFQAPLYYIIAAVVYKISGNVALDYHRVLQGLSLVSFTVCLIFGVLLFQRVCKTKWLFFTSTALLVFWPSGILDSVRISNDPMYDMLFVITMYFLIRWLDDKEKKYFYAASLFLALTLVTKLNGLVLIGIFVCVCIIAILRETKAIVRSDLLKKSRENALNISSLHLSVWFCLKNHCRAGYLKKTLFFITIVVVALYVSLFRNINIALHNSHYDIIVSNMSKISDSVRVENSLPNYVYFDAHAYMTHAFADTFDDAGGRQYFWNFFLKSMLFGEWNFPSALERIAIMLSALLLYMVIFLFIGIFMSIRKLEPSHILLLLWLTLSLSSLMYLRHAYPMAPSADIRLIFPSIIPLIYFYFAGIHFFIEHNLKIIGIFGYIIAFLFIVEVCFFFILLLGA